ncbi:MAG: pyrroloquinoline quinone biosynthesis protein PqqD [Anaerolinea sp. 4484_236]|nr:MAG: pyrroloquinoline quinone biosynthesis protein PqqD [Anaerolinea sp. 4484_236]RLD07955.1 MAG: pyrroloquinoline quinone biosynthesis peptide chaperone PqqD [Chloroflexota bacterium]
MFNLESIPTPNPDIVGRTVDNEAVLVLPVQGKVKVLNEVGTRVWELLDGNRSVKEIASALHQEYTVDQATAEEDVLEFINDLAKKEMLETI